MWRINWPETIEKWFAAEDACPVTIFSDALSMTLMVAVAVLATLAYGL
jgi:hypothetical protein